MPAATKIRELRYLAGTTLATTFTNAAAAAWAPGTATKLRITAWDPSGLTYGAEPDPTLEAQLVRGRPHIPLLRNGQAKFSTFVSGALANADMAPLSTLLYNAMGGAGSVSARTDAVEAGATTTGIPLTGHGLSAGQGVLFGTRGDGYGNGEFRVIKTVTNANHIALNMALSGAPQGTSAVVVADTLFFDEDASQRFIDLLAIGGSAEDQLQTIGGALSFELSGLGAGEVPKVDFVVDVADWQEVASANRDQLESASAAQGGATLAMDRGMGGCFIGDNSSTTRVTAKVTDVVIKPNIAYVGLPDKNGVNGIGGWVRIPAGPPTAEFTVILEGGTDPLPGFYDDFVAGTAKTLMFQWGHAATKCFAVDFEEFYFDAPPVRADAGGLQAVKCVGHGACGALTRPLANADQMNKSPFRIHLF